MSQIEETLGSEPSFVAEAGVRGASQFGSDQWLPPPRCNVSAVARAVGPGRSAAAVDAEHKQKEEKEDFLRET